MHRLIIDYLDELLSGKTRQRPKLNYNNSVSMSMAMCIRSCMDAVDQRKNLKQLKSEIVNVLKIKLSFTMFSHRQTNRRGQRGRPGDQDDGELHGRPGAHRRRAHRGTGGCAEASRQPARSNAAAVRCENAQS